MIGFFPIASGPLNVLLYMEHVTMRLPLLTCGRSIVSGSVPQGISG